MNRRATGLQRLRARLARTFFGNFFRLLLLVISLSEWCVAWWIFPEAIAALPRVLQLIAPLIVYVGNRRLAQHAQQIRRGHAALGLVLRGYYAFAFTSLFCTAFLLLTSAIWIGAKLFVEAISVEAWIAPVGNGVGSGIDAVFRWIADAGLVGIGVAFAYGYTVGQRRLRITRLRLPLRHASPALAGLRIVQVSDIHIGQNLHAAQLEGFVGRVNALRPDLICITGDIIDAPSSDMERFLPVLARLSARHGVLAILGNHDHYAGADRVEAALRRLTPFTVLRDQQTTLQVEGQPLHVIGLDDYGRDRARGADRVAYLARALADLPADEPVLLLSHRPDIFRQAAAAGVALTLAGHTHGGQLGVPWFNGRIRNLAEFVTAFDRGLFERQGCYLYVNCGLGVTGQRIRLCTPREITLIEVHGAAAHAAAA